MTPDPTLATPATSAPWSAAWQQAVGITAAPPASTSVSPDDSTGRRPRSLWSRVVRITRDIVLGLAVIATIPFATVGLMGSPEWVPNSLRDRVREVDRLRVLAVAPNAEITPIAAGEALHRLAPRKPRPGVSVQAVTADVLPWQQATAAPGLFAGYRSTWWAGPAPTQIITRAARGLSADELAWLRLVAEAPLWRDVDLVARARQVDIMGAVLAGPIEASKSAAMLPLSPPRTLREIAEAGVARAAYYVAIKDDARAEEALRSLVSLGLALVDNGTTFLEGITGRLIVDVGRNGLEQLGTLRGRADLVRAAAPFSSSLRRAPRTPFAEREAAALRDLNDRSLPRSYRFEQYGLLSYSSCATATKMLLGPSAAEQAALATARHELPRFASERLVLDYLSRRFDLMDIAGPPRSGLGRVIQGAAEVTSAVTRNPRVATCTRLVVESFEPSALR